ncbi:MAG: HEAT repeat domain-containing protein [Legionellaceae bacterium]|nr:HEAT repeat domain-containing protein [Legionellaceae bacterium]MBP9776143.1 HEAT repeat domain-containing protein [Legionellaceae bacterium]
MFRLFGAKSGPGSTETSSTGGKIEKNIAKLSSHKVQARLSAAISLQGFLSLYNGDAIREAQGIPPLIALLVDSDKEVRLAAARALNDLAHNDTNKDAIRKAQGIPPLIALLTDGVVRQRTAEALWHLALNATNQDAIRKAQGIPPLIALLRCDCPHVKQKAAAVLCNLAANATNQDAIRKAQGIAPLIALLRDAYTEVRREAAAVLCNLAANATNQDAIREAQGIAPLIALLRDTDQGRALLLGNVTEVRREAARALWRLAANATNQDAIRKAQGIAPLIALLRDACPQVRKNAAGALWSLANNHPINQAAMLDNDVLPPLCAVADTDSDANNTLAACQSLIASGAYQKKQPATQTSSITSAAKTGLFSTGLEVQALSRQLAEERLKRAQPEAAEITKQSFKTSSEEIEEFIQSLPSVSPHKPSPIEEWVARQDEREEEEAKQKERYDYRGRQVEKLEFWKYQREMAGGDKPSEREDHYQRKINEHDGTSSECRVS